MFAPRPSSVNIFPDEVGLGGGLIRCAFGSMQPPIIGICQTIHAGLILISGTPKTSTSNHIRGHCHVKTTISLVWTKNSYLNRRYPYPRSGFLVVPISFDICFTHRSFFLLLIHYWYGSPLRKASNPLPILARRMAGSIQTGEHRENSKQIFPEKELHSHSPTNFHIHVSVSDLFIPRSGPHRVSSGSRIGRSIVEYINRSQTHEWWNWTVAVQFFFWEYLFRIFRIGSLQCVENSEWQYCMFVDNFLYIYVQL